MKVVLGLLAFLVTNAVYSVNFDLIPKSFIISIESFQYNEDLKLFNELGLDVAGVSFEENIIDLNVNDQEMKILKNLGYDFDFVYIKGVSSPIDEEYFNPQEIEEEINKLQREYPELINAVSIGKSHEGRDIWAVKISDNVHIREIEEPTILFNSMHHAREVMTPEVSIDIIKTLTSNYLSDERVKNWVNQNEIWVVPMLNVDGNNKVWTGDNMWRKNTFNNYGVDINRNYPYKWGACSGSSGNTSSQTYRGPYAGSEPETQSLMNLVKQIRPVFDISYHSYSELVLYPYGCKGEAAKQKIVKNIGHKLGSLLKYKPGTSWEILYSVDGGDIDWMLAEYQVIPYVIEINSRLQGFQPSYKRWRDKTVHKNRLGWQYLLDRLNGPGVRGLAENQIKTIGVYKMEGNKFVSVQEYRVNDDGTYHIVLDPGTYRLHYMDENNIVIGKEVAELDERRIDFF